jgi:hypothetical protein
MERNKCIEAGVQETAAELSRANEEAKLFKVKKCHQYSFRQVAQLNIDVFP